jgi:hypothetical protein
MMPDVPRCATRSTLAQVMTGFQFPNAVMQFTLEDLDSRASTSPPSSGGRDWVLSALGLVQGFLGRFVGPTVGS